MKSVRTSYIVLRRLALLLALLQPATAAFSQDVRDQHAQSFGELFALGSPHPITDLVVKEFVGTWYEDMEEAYRMQVRASDRAPPATSGRVARPETQLGLKPGKAFVIVYSNRTFRTFTSFSEDRPRALRINGFRIELSSVASADPNAFASVYRFGQRYYVASRESGLIPLMQIKTNHRK